MRYKILSLLAATVFVTACGTAPEEVSSTSGSGETSSVSTSSSNTVDSSSTSGVSTNNSSAATTGTTAIGTVAGGTEQDFLVNVGDRVFFEYDRSDLTAQAQSSLARQAAWLLQYPQAAIQVEGHCDERGTREYNLALGERRANSVREYLISLGVSADRISTISYGKERPAVEGVGNEAWAQNRRGVTRLVSGANS